MDRRTFLKNAGKIIIGLAAGSSLEKIITGCSTINIKKENDLTDYLNFRYSKIEDPNNYLKYLNKNEFVVPDIVLDSYASVVDKRPSWVRSPLAGYLQKNYLDSANERNEFKSKLKKIGLNKEEIKIYNKIFTSEDIIVIKESSLKNKFFEKIILHERLHRNLRKLKKEDYSYMYQVAQELLQMNDSNQEKLIKEKPESPYAKGIILAKANGNFEELYTYLAQGELVPEVEETIKVKYPKAYEIFNNLKEKSKLNLCN